MSITDIPNPLTIQDIEDGKRIALLFSTISDSKRDQALIYLSALRDRQMLEDANKERVEQI